MEGPPQNDLCSVWYGSFTIPCQVNCSHWFCGNCIMMVWLHGSAIQPCKCLLCCCQTTLLVPAEASSRQHHDHAIAEILQKIETYNHLFSGQARGLIQRMRDLPFLLRRLLREMVNPQRSLPFVIRIHVYLSAYFSHMLDYFATDQIIWIDDTQCCLHSPVDIIPEAILGIVGLLDDLLVVLIAFLHIATLYWSVLYHHNGGSA